MPTIQNSKIEYSKFEFSYKMDFWYSVFPRHPRSGFTRTHPSRHCTHSTRHHELSVREGVTRSAVGAPYARTGRETGSETDRRTQHPNFSFFSPPSVVMDHQILSDPSWKRALKTLQPWPAQRRCEDWKWPGACLCQLYSNLS